MNTKYKVAHIFYSPSISAQALASAVENINAKELYIYCNSQTVITALQQYFTNSRQQVSFHLHPQFCTSAEESSDLSHRYSMQRIKELKSVCPDYFYLNDSSEVTFEKPLLRRLSLYMVPKELKIIEALKIILEQQPSSGDCYVVFSYFLSTAEVKEYLGPAASSVYVLTMPEALNFCVFKYQKRCFAKRSLLFKDEMKKHPELFYEKLQVASSSPIKLLMRQPRKTVINKFKKSVNSTRDSLYKQYKEFRRAVRQPRKTLVHCFKIGRSFTSSCFRKKATERKTERKKEAIQLVEHSPSNQVYFAFILSTQAHGIPSRIMNFVPVIRKLLAQNKPVLFLITTLSSEMIELCKQKLGDAIISHPLFVLETVHNKHLNSELLESTYCQYFRDDSAYCLKVFQAGSLDSSRKLLLYNLMAQYERIKKDTVAWAPVLSKYKISNIIGLMDATHLTILSQLRKYHKLSIKIDMMQFGVAAYQLSLSCVDVDTFFITDTFAHKVYLKCHADVKDYQLVGSIEWEPEADSSTADISQYLHLQQYYNRVIILFNQPMNDNVLNPDDMQATYDTLVRYLENHPNTCLIVKPHYRDDIEALKNCFPGHPDILHVPAQTDNRSLLAVADIAVSFYSFALSTALANGVPALAVYGKVGFEPYIDFITLNGGMFAKDSSEVETFLNQYFNNPAVKAEIAERARQFQINLKNESPSQRVVNSILQLKEKPVFAQGVVEPV